MISAGILVFTAGLIIILWRRAQALVNNDIHYTTQTLAISIAWIAYLFFLGKFEILANFESFPPRAFLFFLSLIGFSAFLGFSKFGTALVERLKLWHLVLFQSFRILAEAVIYFGVQEGRAPVALSIHGYNFDIITGVSAIVVGLYLRKNQNLFVAKIFNWMGFGFLVVIAFIAMTSMPNQIRLFMAEPSNIWVTQLPYILLPGVLVVAAITAHLLIFRKIKTLEGVLTKSSLE